MKKEVQWFAKEKEFRSFVKSAKSNVEFEPTLLEEKKETVVPVSGENVTEKPKAKKKTAKKEEVSEDGAL